MIKETRTIHYDAELAIEAYWLQNVLEPFPDHFHDYYLIGFIEKGARELTCGGQKYITTEGDLFTLNPHEPHGCRSYDGKPFSYRGIGVLPDVMRAAMREITGQAILPRFRERILSQSELACSLRDLHAMIVQEDKEFRKEEIFLMLLGQLLRDNAGETPLPDAYKDESDIGAVCAYLEAALGRAGFAGSARRGRGAEQVLPPALVHQAEGHLAVPVSRNHPHRQSTETA